MESPRKRILGFPDAPKTEEGKITAQAKIPKQSSKIRDLISYRVANSTREHKT